MGGLGSAPLHLGLPPCSALAWAPDGALWPASQGNGPSPDSLQEEVARLQEAKDEAEQKYRWVGAVGRCLWGLF